MDNILFSSNSEDNILSNYWQSTEWESAKKENGCNTFVFKTKNSSALVIERRAHRLKFWVKPFWELPRGPVGNTNEFVELIEKIILEAKIRRIEFLRIFPPFYNGFFWSSNFIKNIINKYKTRKSPEIFPCNTLVVNLEKSEKEILAQMKQKGRYNIRIAKKKNVILNEEKDIENFWELMKETTKRDGFMSCKKHVYSDLLKSFGSNSVLFIAKDETGEILAGAIFTIVNNIAMYNYGASSNRKRNFMAPYLLQWEGIKWAKSKNAKLYDFLGIAPENDEYHKLNNVSSFKFKFGGERVICDEGKDILI
jgi:peptidoglycan pentaglycine glycine transferase (the first glycine)